MKPIIGVCFLAAILFLYIFIIKKCTENKAQKTKKDQFLDLARNEYLPILSVCLFGGSTTCVDEKITTTTIDGVFVVEIHIEGPSERLTLNCYIDGFFELVHKQRAVEVEDLTCERIHSAIKNLRVDTQLLTHA